MDDLVLTLIRLGLVGSVFALKLAQALPFGRKELALLPRERGNIVRGLAAMDVAVPLVALLVILVVRPEAGTAIALGIAAAVPAAPLALGSAVKAGGRPGYVLRLHVAAAMLSPLTVPATLVLLGRALGFHAAIDAGAVVQQVAFAVFLPTCLGIALRLWRPRWADRITAPLTKAGSLVLLAVLLLVVADSFELLIAFEPRSYLAIALLVAGALAVGQLLGPPRPGDRTALAIECASRNPGLAMLIASLNFPDARALHVLIPYLLTAMVVSTLYTRRRHRTADPARLEPAAGQ